MRSPTQALSSLAECADVCHQPDAHHNSIAVLNSSSQQCLQNQSPNRLVLCRVCNACCRQLSRVRPGMPPLTLLYLPALQMAPNGIPVYAVWGSVLAAFLIAIPSVWKELVSCNPLSRPLLSAAATTHSAASLPHPAAKRSTCVFHCYTPSYNLMQRQDTADSHVISQTARTCTFSCSCASFPLPGVHLHPLSKHDSTERRLCGASLCAHHLGEASLQARALDTGRLGLPRSVRWQHGHSNATA